MSDKLNTYLTFILGRTEGELGQREAVQQRGPRARVGGEVRRGAPILPPRRRGPARRRRRPHQRGQDTRQPGKQFILSEAAVVHES